MKAACIRILLLGVALVVAVPCCETVSAQTESAVDEALEAHGAPVAYVYVSDAGATANVIHAFAAGSSGALTAVPGSPFAADVTEMAVNGTYLFGNGANDLDIDTLRIAANGALTSVATDDIETDPSYSGCPGVRQIGMDHTGSTLYDLEFTGGLCDEETFHSYNIVKATGVLHDLGTPTQPETAYYGHIRFTGNNSYAYGASCNYYRTGNIQYILGFLRNPSGALSLVLDSHAEPALPFPRIYCPSVTATDPANHVVIAMQEIDFNDPFTPIGPPRLAIYTADASGNLTTTSTAVNMTSVNTGSVADLRLSPGGSVLAVAGAENGVELFHFYGTSRPMRYFTRLLPGEPIVQVLWDNESHLYILSGYGQLFVYTITAHSVTNAPGSPYDFASPIRMVVLPKTVVPEI